MTIEEIKIYITKNFEKVNVIESGGYIFFMYDKNDKFPFATIVTKDSEFDNVSKLDRDGFFRLNIGVDKSNFMSMFEGLSEKKGIGAYLDSGIDFTKEDILLPHPIYGSMYWICVINPSNKTFRSVKKYLDSAYKKISKESNLQ